MQISQAIPSDVPRLFEVWEASVRATHHFLGEAGIQQLVPLVRQILGEFQPIHVLRDEQNRVFAFMGVADGNIEMLFVDPARRGGGAGRALVEFALRELGARKVDVNEQNEQAVGFYARMGFVQAGRSERDPFGNPYPLLHLELAAQ